MSKLKKPRLKWNVLTLFPESMEPVLKCSLLGKAQKKGLVQFNLVQIRDFSKDSHHTVDDKPFGGGEGMLLKVDVLYEAWKSLVGRKKKKPKTILLSPQGPLFTQAKAKELSVESDIILVCGHYEGVDERFVELCVDEQLSVGNYVLTGGEIAALTVMDAVTRLLPGTVGNPDSILRDSLEEGVLKYPQYTRPREFLGLSVPEVLLSGDHKAIEKWRREESEKKGKRNF